MNFKIYSILAFIGIVSAQTDPKCVAPGICQPPANALHSNVLPTAPRHQWEWDGGFCGSLSIQTIALAHGVWIS